MRRSRKRRQKIFDQEEGLSHKDPAKDFWGLDTRVVLIVGLIAAVGLSIYLGWIEIADMDRNGP